MKVLILTLLLLALMLTAMAVNGVYVNNVTDSLLRMLEALPSPQDEDSLSAVLAVQAEWKKHADVIRFSAGYANWDRVEEHIELIASCLEHGDLFGYYSALTLLQDALEDLRRQERLTLDSWI